MSRLRLQLVDLKDRGLAVYDLLAELDAVTDGFLLAPVSVGCVEFPLN
ncbi:MAG: hypothetical protein PVF95_14095 [bacterium]|jgi:hypothetical protein